MKTASVPHKKVDDKLFRPFFETFSAFSILDKTNYQPTQKIERPEKSEKG